MYDIILKIIIEGRKDGKKENFILCNSNINNSNIN